MMGGGRQRSASLRQGQGTLIDMERAMHKNGKRDRPNGSNDCDRAGATGNRIAASAFVGIGRSHKRRCVEEGHEASIVSGIAYLHAFLQQHEALEACSMST